MIRLPPEYVKKMKSWLGDEAEPFLRSYEQPRTHGLRLNPLKIAADDASIRSELTRLFGLAPVPWCATGYYYVEDVRPGKHPYHAAGLYYIQEPSAMSAVELLAPEPGDAVLDLAAAPGGKATQIAGKLDGAGLLVANEIHPARAKALSENIERMGVRNAVVTSAAPDELAGRFPLFFNKIMVDAPCSGEGMFRKDPETADEWSPRHVAMCAARQLDILRSAVRMLKPGGRLGYSTCTFSPEENEQAVEAIANEHPELRVVSMERIWPHKQRGEGHFVAVLEKAEDAARSAAGAADAGKARTGRRKPSGQPAAVKEALRLFAAFAGETLPGWKQPDGEAVLFGEQLYLLPRDRQGQFHPALLEGLKMLRPGLHLGTVRKARFEPAHALALALRAGQAGNVLALAPDSVQAEAYLRGEAIAAGNSGGGSGWTVVTVNGYPLGWGKQSAGQLKNHYPKGLRWHART